MGKFDRREKSALDESYRYCRNLEKNVEEPELYRLARCLKTMAAALNGSENGDFKLTRQLWRRVQQSLFDKMITTFSGYVLVSDENGQSVQPKANFPEDGLIEFHPTGCRRADDIFQMEIKHLYPGTQTCLTKAWQAKGAEIAPSDFTAQECSNGACPMKPVVFGHEVLGEESEQGRNKAYHDWWDLYLQAYCTGDEQLQRVIYRRMDELESVWGNLFY